MVGDKTLLELPTGKWVRFDITAALGENSDGAWTLGVTVPGQQTRRFKDLKGYSGAFQRLTWLGFVSNATATTTFYLDNLAIMNSL